MIYGEPETSHFLVAVRPPEEAATQERQANATGQAARPPLFSVGCAIADGRISPESRWFTFRGFTRRPATRVRPPSETAAGCPRTSARVAAYGDVDEWNLRSWPLLCNLPDAAEAELLKSIQNDLFDVGADLCVPPTTGARTNGRDCAFGPNSRCASRRPSTGSSPLQPLTSSPLTAWEPAGRCVVPPCARRSAGVARVPCCGRSHGENVNPQVVIYLNRLSDLLFVLARVYNNQGRADVLWQPGKTQV